MVAEPPLHITLENITDRLRKLESGQEHIIGRIRDHRTDLSYFKNEIFKHIDSVREEIFASLQASTDAQAARIDQVGHAVRKEFGDKLQASTDAQAARIDQVNRRIESLETKLDRILDALPSEGKSSSPSAEF